MALQDGKLAENDGQSLDSLLKSGYKPLDNDEEEDSSDDDSSNEDEKLVIFIFFYCGKFRKCIFTSENFDRNINIETLFLKIGFFEKHTKFEKKNLPLKFDTTE